MTESITVVLPVARAACAKALAQGFAALTEPERVAFLVWIAIGEADNGGLHAICYNSEGDYIRFFPAAFEAIGATELSAVFAGLRALAEEAGLAEDHATRAEQHAALPDAALSRIDDLEQRYNASSDAAFLLLASYLVSRGAA